MTLAKVNMSHLVTCPIRVPSRNYWVYTGQSVAPHFGPFLGIPEVGTHDSVDSKLPEMPIQSLDLPHGVELDYFSMMTRV